MSEKTDKLLPRGPMTGTISGRHSRGTGTTRWCLINQPAPVPWLQVLPMFCI